MKDKGTLNKKYYHWRLTEFEDNNHDICKGQRCYTTINKMRQDYPSFNRTKIYNLHNGYYKYKKDCCLDYKRFKVEKIKELVGAVKDE